VYHPRKRSAGEREVRRARAADSHLHFEHDDMVCAVVRQEYPPQQPPELLPKEHCG
jgi:hypothetical protein